MNEYSSKLLNEAVFRNHYGDYKNPQDAFEYVQGQIDYAMSIGHISESERQKLYSLNDKIYDEHR